MEGNIYKCSWEKKNSGYRIFLLANKKIDATGRDFSTTKDDLCDKICGLLGDAEAVLDFDKAQPVESKFKKWFNDDCFCMSANQIIKSERSPSLYEFGICDCCKSGLGNRTNVVRKIMEKPTLDVCILRSLETYIFSEKIVGLFMQLGMEEKWLLPVEFSLPGIRRKYFELVQEPIIQQVGAKDVHVHGWQCQKCKTKSFVQSLKNECGTFLLRKDFKTINSSFFVAGKSGIFKELVFSKTINDAIKKATYLKGALTEPVAILDNEDADISPCVSIYGYKDFSPS